MPAPLLELPLWHPVARPPPNNNSVAGQCLRRAHSMLVGFIQENWATPSEMPSEQVEIHFGSNLSRR